MRGWSRRFTAASSFAALAACAADEPNIPNLAEIYAQPAAIQESRRPVITIPGTLGSRLVDRDSGVVVWGDSDRLSADPEIAVEARAIGLPIGTGGESLRSLRDEVGLDGVVRIARASILGFRIELDIYQGIINTLIAGGYDFLETREAEVAERDVNLDAFEFPYDWRRDIVEAASDLDFFIRRKADQVREERIRVLGDAGPPVKFDLVAHSMGTLVARYYLMYGAADLPEDGSLPELTWAGAEFVDRAIMIAGPKFGSILALENIVNGKTFGPFQPVYPPALLGTHVATYQLLPRDRHDRVHGPDGGPLGRSLYDVATWEENGWGLLDPSQDAMLATLMPDEPDPEVRRARARNHLEKILARTEQFHRAIDRPNTPPPGLDMFLVVGGGFATPAGATWLPDERRMEITEFEEGDGVVLRASTLADERQGSDDYRLGLDSPHSYRSILFLPDEHVELTLSPVFGDNLLFWLLEGQKAPAILRDPRRSSIALEGAGSSLTDEVLAAAEGVVAPRDR